jgi:EcsC family protein
MSELTAAALAELAEAKRTLERPSLAIRIADLVGVPIDAVIKRLPDAAQRRLAEATRKALDTSLQVALRTLDHRRRGPAGDWLHRGVVMATGAAGGAVGIAGLVVELPITTTVMLRSIADHARAQGEDLSQVAARLECLTVFAYGSPSSESDDAAESAYFAARAALARAVSQAAEWVAERGLAEAAGERAAPAVARLVAGIAQRFGVAVTDKAAAQLVPVVGAAGGAAVNALFIRHYQDTARAHFTVRRLEREHGAEAVRAAYGNLAPESRRARGRRVGE